MFTSLQYINPIPAIAIAVNAINTFVVVSAVVLLSYITTLLIGVYLLSISCAPLVLIGIAYLLLLI